MPESRPRSRFLLGFALGALLATATTAIAQHGFQTLNNNQAWGIRTNDTARLYCIDGNGLPRAGTTPGTQYARVGSGPPWNLSFSMVVVTCPG